MQFRDLGLYHIYNRGNNKQPIFFGDNNYAYFLDKVRKQIVPHCDILAYCLMPNHFHFLARIKAMLTQSSKQIDVKESISQQGSIRVQTERHPLTSAIGILCSAHTRKLSISKMERLGHCFNKRRRQSIWSRSITRERFLIISIKTPFELDWFTRWKIGHFLLIATMLVCETAV